MKKVFWIILIFLLLTGAGAIYYYFFSDIGKSYPPAQRVLPPDAALVLKSNHFFSTWQKLQKTETWQALSKNEAIKTLNGEIALYDSLLHQDKELVAQIADKPLFFSLHQTAANQVDLLTIIQLKKRFPEQLVKEKIKLFYDNATFNERTFEDTKIFEVQVKGQEVLAFTLVEGIIAISKNPVLVEDAVRAWKREPSSIQEAVTNASEQVLVNYESLPAFLSIFLNSESKDILNRLSRFSGVGKYELSLKDQMVSLHGLLTGKSASHFYVDLFKDQKAGPLKISQVVPFRTALFIDFNLSDIDAFQQQLAEFSNTKNYALQNAIDSLKEAEGFSLTEDFLPVFGNEIAFVVNEPLGNELQSNAFALTYYQDIKQKLEFIEALKDKVEQNDISTTAPILYRKFAIQQLGIGNAFQLAFGKIFSAIKDPYYIQIHNFLLFASQPDVLKRVIDDYLSGQTLYATQSYQAIAEEMLSESNFTFYMNPSRALNIPEPYLSNNFKDIYRQNYTYFKSFSAFAFQINEEGNAFYNQMTAFHSDEVQLNTELLWKQKLDGAISKRPQIVLNHNTNDKEVMVSDDQNNLYLVSNSGNILWQKGFDYPIVGEINQVDLYKNDKLQYVFNTQDKLQLIDRNSHNVANFPIRLGDEATASLAVFDYHNRKDYDYFAVTKNKKVYGFEGGGKPLLGWNPKELDGVINNPVKYFIFGGKIYVLAATLNGTFYLWDEKGREIFKPLKLKTQFRNPFYIHFGKDKTSTFLTSSDTAGFVYKINLEGKYNKKKFGKWGKAHFFNFLDVDLDGDEDFVFAENTSIKVFDQDSSVIATLTLNDSLQYSPQFFEIRNKIFIGYPSVKTDQLFLIDIQGVFYDGFPLKGDTPFSIDDINNDGELELVTGGSNQMLYLYRLR